MQAQIVKLKRGFDEACEEQGSLLRKVGRGGGATNIAKSFRKNKLNSQMSDMLVANGIKESVQEQFFYLLQRCFFVPAGITEVFRK